MTSKLASESDRTWRQDAVYLLLAQYAYIAATLLSAYLPVTKQKYTHFFAKSVDDRLAGD